MKSTANGGTVESAAAKPNGRSRGRRPGPPGDWGEGASAVAKRQTAAILEVLAGMRTPAQAAEALGVSLPRYYLLEQRAVQGMLVACEPRTLGRQATTASALAAVKRECEHWRRECARQQALVRAARRAMGLAPPAPVAAREGNKRRHRPQARALRMAARLQARESASAPTDVAAS